jgi:CheY-like chemotaxis protein/HD-like signal output (HDOD) protein
MAYILLVDPDEMARRVMKGIVARGNHRFVAVDTATEAWEFIRRNVKVDLVIVELALKGEPGLALIQKLKGDPCLKLLPVIVYTAKGDRETVKRVLQLRAQNFLIKPYHDDSIFSEIAKALVNPWRQLHFEEEKSFCKMTGLTPEGLHKLLEDLRTALVVAREPLRKRAGLHATQPAIDEITILSEKAEAAGAWGVVECLKYLNEKALGAKWAEFDQELEILDFANQLIFRHLNAALVPPDFLTSQEANAEIEAHERSKWSDAVAQNRCPVVNWSQLQNGIDGLAGCPIIDSVAASFQMTANGHPTSLNPLMDLVEKDPGLTAQMLIACNQLKRAGKEDSSPIEDPRMAVGLLGEVRLAAQGRGIITAEERMMTAPPQCNWSHFWMFQIGTARIAKYTCRYLGLSNLEAAAYTAGLMHDLGKLLLLRLHPFAFQAILGHARQHELTLSGAEKMFLGVTTREMAVYFAEKHGLPKRFVNVMRWIDDPEKATEDMDLIAVISLSRDLCRHNHVGFCGETPLNQAVSLDETPEWRVLRNSVFPSFDLKKFESQVHAECRQLKNELHGRMTRYAVA